MTSVEKQVPPGDPTSAAGEAAGEGGATNITSRSGNVGVALRHVYDEMVQESVPDELLSLLGKLS